MSMATDNTQQIPASGDYYQQGAPTPPAPPTPPAGQSFQKQEPPRRERRGIAALTGVALLAAVLASGGTYAVTQLTDTPTPTTTTSTTTQNQGTSPTVIQGSATAPDWTAVAKAVSPSVVSIDVTTQQSSGAGSGVILDNKGHVLTNNHVVGDATGTGAISVTLADGRTYGATIVGTDPSTDLAVIKLTSAPSDLTPISLGDSSVLAVGDPVMAVGNPLGLSGTVTTGIVSALNRPVSTSEASPSPDGQTSSDTVVTNAIQTSAAINPGNSGGALVNAKGELIGINSAIASLGATQGSQSGNIGIGFAIPVNEAKSISDQLIKTGQAEHAFLGVSAKDTTVKDGTAQRAGAQVASVSDGTPAAQAGIKTGDVIIAVNGQPVDSSTALVAQIRAMTAGDKATVTLIRDGARQDVQVTLAVKPSSTS
ncbi:MAG TPA: trypsin-like peptidase domain-containing protein [Humibacillus sp.]|nr:trypsin-like peptidase domain-containing protein [Humibacillus sp.]